MADEAGLASSSEFLNNGHEALAVERAQRREHRAGFLATNPLRDNGQQLVFAVLAASKGLVRDLFSGAFGPQCLLDHRGRASFPSISCRNGLSTNCSQLL